MVGGSNFLGRFVSRFFKILYAFTDPAAYLRKLAGAKYDENNDQDNDQFRHAYSKHRLPPVLELSAQLLQDHFIFMGTHETAKGALVF
jgi:hypothetical protein